MAKQQSSVGARGGKARLVYNSLPLKKTGKLSLLGETVGSVKSYAQNCLQTKAERSQSAKEASSEAASKCRQ